MPFDEALTGKVLGAAEGSYYGTTDIRYTPTKASPGSGVSFGIVQLDASQGPGRAALSDVLKALEGKKTIDAATSKTLLSRYTGAHARDALSEAERVEMAGILSDPTAKPIIDRHDGLHIADRQTAVANVLEGAAEYWRDKDGITYPRLADPKDSDYVELAAYILATLNKRPDNAGMFGEFLRGKGVALAGKPGRVLMFDRPPFPSELHALQPQLKCWQGANGRYANLVERMKGVVPAHLSLPPKAPVLPPVSVPPRLAPLAGANMLSIDGWLLPPLAGNAPWPLGAAATPFFPYRSTR